MTFTFGGLATGLDTNSIIEGFLQLERQPITRLGTKRAGIERKISSLGALRSTLASFESLARGLRSSGSSLLAYTASSTNEAAISATVSKAVSAGSISAEVVRLAQTEIETSDGFADTDTETAGTGVLSISAGGNTVDITVDSSNNTIQKLVTAINEAEAGVTATIINDGGTNPYRLVLTADEAGDDQTISIDTSGLTGGDRELVFGETRAARSAQVRINGIPVTSNRNVIDDAIQGVTLTLKAVTPEDEPATLAFNVDVNKVIDRIEKFVDGYNTVIDELNKSATYDQESESSGPLFGDFTARVIRRRLQSLVTSTYDVQSESITSLSALGASTGRNGRLSIDRDALTDAIETDPDAVAGLFLDSDGGLAAEFADFARAQTRASGGIDARQESLLSGLKQIDRRVERLEARLERVETDLRKRFTQLETYASRFQGYGDYLSTAFIQTSNRSSR